MDSITQLALGSVVGYGCAGKTLGKKALLWGAILGTVPDLDVLLTVFLTPVEQLMVHRGYTHSWIVHVFLSPLLAKLLSVWHKDKHFKRWLYLVFWVLFTHSLIDWFTLYGTQIFKPLDHTPYSLGNIFIIDPIFTLPLVVTLGLGVFRKNSVRVSQVILGFCAVYALVAFIIQQNVQSIALNDFDGGIEPTQMIVSNTPFNIVLWRVVVLGETDYWEGLVSVFDKKPVEFVRYGRRLDYLADLTREKGDEFSQLVHFSRGYFRLRQVGDWLVFEDIRITFQGTPIFGYKVAHLVEGRWEMLHPIAARAPFSGSFELGEQMRWLWGRMWGY